jgi:NADH-quinone oxidoreductase subunit M
MVLAAVYILWMYQRMMTGPTPEKIKTMPDLNLREKIVVAPLLALLIGFGFFPKPLLDVINPAVHQTLTSVHVTPFTPAIPATAEKKGAGQ